ncbi:MAG TPA: polysaccharide deacetylase family protein [Bacteroidia bacterium]
MRIRKRLIILSLLVGGFIAYKIYKRQQPETVEVNNKMIFTFNDLEGPAGKSVILPGKKTSWRKYSLGPNYGIGILLTDTNSSWLGLVHAFKSFGIPFKIHTNTESALQHEMVIVYPFISGKVCKEDDLKLLDKFLQNKGTLVGINVLGGLNESFGFMDAIPSRKNFFVNINDNESSFTKEFTDDKEKQICLGNNKMFKETIGTHSYSKPLTKPLLTYESGEACMTQYYYKGGGKAFALGIDLGEFVLRSQNERGYNAYRNYVNGYEPTLDVLIRLLKNIYTQTCEDAVILNAVPGEQQLAVCITHDIDFTRSIKHAVDYAKMEHERNIPATYFIQTKYIKDWNDDIFFNEQGVEYLKKIHSYGMEIGSHSVAHSYIYSKFEPGSGEEKYPEYRPFVKGKKEATGGSVLGELRVSKFLLEANLKNAAVVSFRPGHLSYPFSLPQSLLATGYKYSSGITANNALTHLPYQLQFNREYDQELDIFEFPVTVEDEKLPRMDLRLGQSIELARKISKYGGLMNVLIHTDTLDYKLKYEKMLIDSLKSSAQFFTLSDYAAWWTARNYLTFSVEQDKGKLLLKVNCLLPLKEFSFIVPSGWKYDGTDPNVLQSGTKLLVHEIKTDLTISFIKSK